MSQEQSSPYNSLILMSLEEHVMLESKIRRLKGAGFIIISQFKASLKQLFLKEKSHIREGSGQKSAKKV